MVTRVSTFSDCNTQHSAVIKGHFWWLETPFLRPVRLFWCRCGFETEDNGARVERV